MRYTQSGLSRKILKIAISIAMLAVISFPLLMNAYANTNIIQAITGYYYQYLNRAPDQAGLNYWVTEVTNNGKTLAFVENAIKYSDEAKIRGFYLQYLNREPDQAGLTYWLNQRNNGVSLAAIEIAIRFSQEAEKDLVLSQTPQGMAPEPSTKAITVHSNTTWNVDTNNLPTWLSASPAEGNNHGTVTMTASPNTDTTARQATITFTAQGEGSSTFTKTITVQQNAREVITDLNPSNKVGYVAPLKVDHSKFSITVTWSAGEREFYPLYEHKATIKIVPKQGQTWGSSTIEDFKIEGATNQTVISPNEISVTFPKTGSTRKFRLYNFSTAQFGDASITLCDQRLDFDIWIQVDHMNEANCNKVKDWTSDIETFATAMLNNEFGGALSDVDFNKKFDIVFSPIVSNGNVGAYHVKHADFNNCYDVHCGEHMVIYTDTFYKNFVPTTKHYVRTTIAHELHHNVFSASSDTWFRESLATAAEHFYYKSAGFAGQVDFLNRFNNASDRFSWKVTDFNGSALSYAKVYFFSQYLRTQAESKGNYKIFKEIMELEKTNSTKDAIEKAIKQYIDPNLTFDTFMANFELALQRKDPTGPYGFNGEAFFNGLK